MLGTLPSYSLKTPFRTVSLGGSVDNERLGSNVQTRTAPELVFRALLTQDGAQRLELARA